MNWEARQARVDRAVRRLIAVAALGIATLIGVVAYGLARLVA